MTVSRWTPEFLASMRQEMDPEADEVVRRIFEDGGPRALGGLHGELVRKDGLPVETLPPYLKEYLRATAEPGDSDPEALRMAEELLSSHGVIAFTILACASLPECYVDRPGVPVLWETQKLNTHVHRRCLETTRFVMGVMSPGGLEREGAGVRAAQKVRLMHASIRHLMLQTPDEVLAGGQADDISDVFRSHRWKEELGMPLNQEDLAYTLQTFGWVTVRSLRRLGSGLTPDQEEAVIHLWNATGRMMGIREDLLPADVADAQALFEAIKARVAGESVEGRSLTAAVTGWAESHIPRALGHYRHVPRMMTRYLVDEPTAEMLGVPALTAREEEVARTLTGVILEVEGHEERASRNSQHHRTAAEWLFRTMVKGLMKMPRGWERELFDVPDHLADAWQVVEVE
jgi:hypothetical protein